MTLRAQVTGGLILLLLLSTGLAAYQLILTRQLHQANRQLASVDLELSRASLRLRRHIDRLTGLTQRYAVLRDPGYVDELRRGRRAVDLEIRQLEAVLPAEVAPPDRPPVAAPEVAPSRVDRTARDGTSVEATQVAALRDSWQSYVELAERLEMVVGSGTAPSSDQVVDEILAAVLEALAQPYELALSLDNEAVTRAAEEIEVSSKRAATAYRVTFIVALLGLALTLGLVFWIGYSTATPLRALTRGAEAMAAGDFEHRVTVSGPTELALLARDFNSLAQKLGELDQTKRDFLASVSHDLKAPLASIQETTRLLLEQESGLTPEQRKFLELNAQSARRLEAMVSDLLDIARLEADSVTFQLEYLDLNDCCEEAVDQAAGLLAHKRQQAAVQLADDRLPIRADVALLLQALANLLSNAVKYSPEGSTLHLKTGVGGKVNGRATARVYLRDQGPGVPDIDKERIFDRFFCSRTDTSRPSGTGLGLAIVRSVVEHHGGRVWVEDDQESTQETAVQGSGQGGTQGGAQGGGSVFIVELPTASPPDLSPPAPYSA